MSFMLLSARVRYKYTYKILIFVGELIGEISVIKFICYFRKKDWAVAIYFYLLFLDI